MMSKKDYELVAKALYLARPSGSDQTAPIYKQWLTDCYSVAANLISTNPRFDHHRFLEACGYYLNT